MFLPGHELQETQNKVEAFRLFAYADQELRLPKDRLEALPKMVHRAAGLGNYNAIWALEGVAYYYTSSALLAQQHLRGLLADPEIPETAMVSAHAGMGMACAGDILRQLSADPAETELRDAMQRFFDFCLLNSRAGWSDEAMETMGIAVRNTHPHLVKKVSAAIAALDPHAHQLFWHGVGRSLYFVASNFAAFGASHARALRTAIDEAPGVMERRNALAGLLWAVTLVNVRHPAVLKNMLQATRSLELPEAVINGITSALMVWKHMVPGDTAFLPQYLRLQNDQLWNERVAKPALHAFAEVYPDLLRQGRIATLFSFRGLHE